MKALRANVSERRRIRKKSHPTAPHVKVSLRTLLQKSASAARAAADAFDDETVMEEPLTTGAHPGEAEYDDDALPPAIGLPMKVNTVSAPVTHVEYPWSRLLLCGVKAFEIRAYDLPAAVTKNGGDVWLMELPGQITAEDIRLVPWLRELPQKAERSEIIGMLRLGHSTQYASWSDFDADIFQHCLHPSAQGYFGPFFRRHDMLPYKWEVMASRELVEFLPGPSHNYLQENSIMTRTADFGHPTMNLLMSDLQEYWMMYESSVADIIDIG